MSDKLEVGNGMFGYTLNFASVEFVNNIATKTTISINRQDPVGVVKRVLKDTLGSRKKLIADDVGNGIDFIAPRISGFELINSLAARSSGKADGSFGFLFFETPAGFNYRNLNMLKQQKPQEYKFSRTVSVNPDVDRMRVVQNIQLEDAANILDRIDKSAFGANITIFDPLKRVAYRKKISYFDQRVQDKLDKIEGDSAKHSLQTKEFSYTNPSSEMLLPLSDRSIGKVQRMMLINTLEYGIRYNVDIPGNSTLHAGQMIDLQLPSSTGEDIINNEEDRFMTGNYLVTCVRHKFTKNNHVMSLQIVKDSFKNDHDQLQATLKKRI
jgi:hypothetical protein